MNLTPQDAKHAVGRVLAEVNREHEAAYSVIAAAVRVCYTSGMNRKQTARYLGIQARRISASGQYARTLRGTLDLFRGAFSTTGFASSSVGVDNLIKHAWKK